MLGAYTAYLRLFFARNLGAYYAFGWGMGRGVCCWGSQQHDASHKTKVGRIGHKHFGMGCSASLRARLVSHLRRSGILCMRTQAFRVCVATRVLEWILAARRVPSGISALVFRC